MSSNQHEKISLQKSGEAANLLEERHILDDDIKAVIDNAETTSEKLYQPGTDRYLAKMRKGNASFYVEYSLIFPIK